MQKAVSSIKADSILFCIDDDREGCDIFRVRQAALKRVHQKHFTDPFPFAIGVDLKPAHQRGWYEGILRQL